MRRCAAWWRRSRRGRSSFTGPSRLPRRPAPRASLSRAPSGPGGPAQTGAALPVRCQRRAGLDLEPGSVATVDAPQELRQAAAGDGESIGAHLLALRLRPADGRIGVDLVDHRATLHRRMIGPSVLDTGEIEGLRDLRRAAVADDCISLLLEEERGIVLDLAELDVPPILEDRMVDVHLGADAEGAELAPYTGRHRLGTELDHQQVTQRVAPGPQLQQHPVGLGLGMDQRRDRAMGGLGAQEDWKARRLGVVLAAIDGKRVDAGTMKRPQQLEASHDPRRIIEAGQARGPQRPVGGGGQPLLPGCQPLYVGEYE